MNKLFYTISWFTILSAMGIMSLAGYWYFKPYRLIEFKNQPFPVVNENREVDRGGRIRYRIDYCKYTDNVPMLKKFFVDGVLYEISETMGALPSGCNVVESDTYIPRAIPAGEYKIKIVIKYRVNPIRSFEFISYTENFIIK